MTRRNCFQQLCNAHPAAGQHRLWNTSRVYDRQTRTSAHLTLLGAANSPGQRRHLRVHLASTAAFLKPDFKGRCVFHQSHHVTPTHPSVTYMCMQGPASLRVVFKRPGHVLMDQVCPWDVSTRRVATSIPYQLALPACRPCGTVVLTHSLRHDVDNLSDRHRRYIWDETK